MKKFTLKLFTFMGTSRTRSGYSRSGTHPLLKFLNLLFLAHMLAPAPARAQDRNQEMNIVYPPGAFVQNGGPVINIKNTTLFSPNAAGDGVTDDTAAFIAMLDYLADQAGRTSSWSGKTDPKLTVYLPSGTYLVSDRLVHSGSVTDGFNFLRLVGQNRGNTVIKLKNYASGFGPGAKKEVLCFTKYWEGYNGGSKWGNILRNITIDTGTGNPGAVGVSFFAANAGSIDNLTVRSGDGAGYAGIYFPGWSVQGHFMDITVEGFNEAVRTESVIENNPIFEFITIQNQLVNGLSLGRSAACVRKLKSTNTVPAVAVWGDGAHTVLLDSELTGGSPANSAIRLLDSAKQQLFVRNVSVSGYGTAIQKDGVSVSTAPHIGEWQSGQVFRSSGGTPDQSMNLPVEEFPMKLRDSDPAQWVSPDDFPGSSDAAKIQAALNSGKPNIYFPRYYFSPQETVLTIPATVKHLDFMSQESWLWGGMRIDEASSDPLYIEGSGRKTLIRVNAQRTVAARNGSLNYYVQTSLPVTAHFSNIAVLAGGHSNQFCPPNATIYARNINEESWNHTNFVVNGGVLWVMGYKTEADHTAFHAKNGGFLEVLGGYVNFAGQHSTQRPDVLNENANVSYIGTNFMFRTHWEGIHEIFNGNLTKFLNVDFPDRITGHSNNYFVPLYVGYDPVAVQNRIAEMGGGPSGTVDRDYWTGVSGTTIGSLTSHANFPNNPSGSDTLTSLRAVNWSDSSQTSNWADNYGQRIRGYIVAPQTGNYTFWISGDDHCELWLSTGSDPAQKQRIAYVNGWTAALEWNKFASQKSVPISLTAGQTYYVEMLHKEGSGGDNLAAGWLKPGQSGTSPSEVVPGSVLLSYYVSDGGGGGGSDPVAHYQLDETSGTTASDSAGSNHGTLYNFSTSGWGNGALAFDGVNDYVEVPNDASLNSTSGTVAFWVKPNVSVPSSYQSILGKHTSSGSKAGFNIIHGTSGALHVQIKSGGSEVTSFSGGSLAADTWQHVALVYESGGTSKLYVNGVEVSSQSTVSFTMTSSPLRIGRSLDNWWAPFGGSLDDVRIHNVKLTASEIEALVGDSDLVAHYKLDETSGTTASDSAGANDGTLYNFSTSGWGNGALAFDGVNDYVEVPDDASLNSASGTVAFWVKPNVSTPSSSRSMVGKHTPVGSKDGFNIIHGSNGSVRVQIKPSGGEITDLSGGSLNAGVWTHVALVYESGGTSKLYVDGVEVSSQSTVSFTITSSPLRIGRSLDNWWMPFGGSLDDIQIYNAKLTASEIAYLAGIN